MAVQSTQSYSLTEVKDISILDVCDRLGIQATRRGKNYWCKLRDERHPSVILHLDNNTFYDFGTQEHGSNIDLVCCVTGKSFGEAVRYLGESFGLIPESPEEAHKRFLTMSRTDYARIGLHADLATKNFTFPIETCDWDKLLKIEMRYQMPMNTLRKRHPKTYERILREKAIPSVDRLRNLYYLSIWNYYSLLQSTGRTFLFYDSERTQARFAGQTKQLEQAERSLFKAGQGTNLSIPEPAHYDPMRVISRFLTDRLSISIGSCSPDEFSAFAKEECSELTLPHDTYFAVDLDDFPHTAILTKDHVQLCCLEKDLPMITHKASLHYQPQALLDDVIRMIEARREDTSSTQRQRETVLTR